MIDHKRVVMAQEIGAAHHHMRSNEILLSRPDSDLQVYFIHVLYLSVISFLIFIYLDLCFAFIISDKLHLLLLFLFLLLLIIFIIFINII